MPCLHKSHHLLVALVSFAVVLTISDARPQLSLTVVDDEETTTPRQHPPTIEDVEERRKKLVGIIPGGGESSGGGGGQLQTLTDLGLDLVGGSVMNFGEFLAPVRNATRKAKEQFPRVGDVINRAVDSSREYRNNIRTAFRERASSGVNNGIRLFTTFSGRAAQVFSGVFKLIRTLFDNLTLSIQNFAVGFSKFFLAITKGRLPDGFFRNALPNLRKAVQNPRLLQPLKDLTELGTGLVRGAAEDLTAIQPIVTDGLKGKVTLGAAFIPRANIAKILYPLANPEPCSSDEQHDETARESKESASVSDDSPASLSSDDSTSMTQDDLPDGLDSLSSNKAEMQQRPEEMMLEGQGSNEVPIGVLMNEMGILTKMPMVYTKSEEVSLTSVVSPTTKPVEFLTSRPFGRARKRQVDEEQVARALEDLFGYNAS